MRRWPESRDYFDSCLVNIDIIDINAGTGVLVANNFDPEINFPQNLPATVWVLADTGRWGASNSMFEVQRTTDLPVVATDQLRLGMMKCTALSAEPSRVPTCARFWMGFGEHYINDYSLCHLRCFSRASR